MPSLRVILLWHQHQPFYKDLVTGEYRLPWTRLHALKDYYGMVKLLDEFPNVHQNFNLVPSLMVQIQDYAEGTAQDPFLQVAAKPAKDLSQNERRFALQYLFQANPQNVIGRYPRYRELWERFREHGDHPERAERYFQAQDFTDLQVLSQIAWFDEFFLEEKDIAALVAKGHDFSLDDQKLVIAQREGIAWAGCCRRMPRRRRKDRSSFRPRRFIIPSCRWFAIRMRERCRLQGCRCRRTGFAIPRTRANNLRAGSICTRKFSAFGPRECGPRKAAFRRKCWPSRTAWAFSGWRRMRACWDGARRSFFARDGNGRLPGHLAEKLYNIHRYENGSAAMHLVFRDHTISDLIGFVYSGMPPADAARHLIGNIKEAAQPVLARGRDAVVSIILDGENAWEYYPKSGREFLRRSTMACSASRASKR